MLNLLPPTIQHCLTSAKLLKIIYLFFTLMKTKRNFFHLTQLLQYTQEKRTLKKFYPFSYLYLNLTKLKVLSVIAINVISAKIILYLIIHLGVTLLVEYIVLEVACHIATLIWFTSFLVRILETSMKVQLLIFRPALESTKTTSRLRKVAVLLPIISTTDGGIEAIPT